MILLHKAFILFVGFISFLALLASGEVLYPNTTRSVSLQTGGPWARCDGLGLCDKGDGGVMFGETMEKHLFPHALWIFTDGIFHSAVDPANTADFTDRLLLQVGDIVIFEKEFEARLQSAILSTYVRFSDGLYLQLIADGQGTTANPEWFGYLIVGPPVPEPDNLFESLVQDPLLAAIPSVLRSVVDPGMVIPSPTPGCQPTKCFQFIKSADVFYFGPEPTITACLRDITNPAPLPTTPPIPMNPASVYVVFQSIEVFDNCRHWVGGNPPITVSFNSDTLSTVEYRTDAPPATKVMNYTDLPCPPPEIAQYLNPTLPYSPILIQLFRTYMPVNGSDEVCEKAAVIDPPARARRVDSPTGRKDGGDVIP